MKITHLTAHLGAGAGKAIVGLSKLIKEQDSSADISIVICDTPVKRDYINIAINNHINIIETFDDIQFRKICEESDVIIVDWWAHPLMFNILLKMNGIMARVILWIHINGCVYPIITEDFLSAFDFVIFTCKYSFENEYWSKNFKNLITHCADVVYGIGDFDPIKWKQKEYTAKKEIIIGYLGTIDYSKMNNQWIDISERIYEKRNNIRFVLYGDISDEVMLDIQKSSIAKITDYKGYSRNVEVDLSGMDIFVYPLNPATSGTTENVILEAMTVGLPIVVFNQGTEKHIVKDKLTGICADSATLFVDSVIRLIDDWEYRKQLGENARRDIIENYDGKRNASHFYEIIGNVCENDKKAFEIESIIGNTPYDFFIQCIGRLERINDADIKEKIFQCAGKSSLKQFIRIYDDDRLKELYDNYWKK